MGVQLNIKDETVVRLARELAQAEGKSVTLALRELLEKERGNREKERERRVRDVLELVKELQTHWNPETRGMTSKELMDSIYDEHGLPK